MSNVKETQMHGIGANMMVVDTFKHGNLTQEDHASPPGDGKETKQEMHECYVKILAIVLGSDEETIKSIYNVFTEQYYGFGFQIS